MDPEYHSDRPEEAGRYRAFFREHDEDARAARGWYCHSKAGVQGPFASQEQAEQDIARLMNSDVWDVEKDETKSPGTRR